MTQVDQVSLVTEDGAQLEGTLWRAPEGNESEWIVLINSGMGILASYYGRFAEYLCESNVNVLTYDYRGIGKSKPTSLLGFRASVEQWGRMDCNAGIQWLGDHFPRSKICVIGHSVGAFLTGFAPNNSRIQKYLTICGHSAYWRDYKSGVRIPMYLLWHLFMPAVTRMVGYFPGSTLRLLEDLPYDVALEWANRKTPEFWSNLRTASGELDSERIQKILSQFAELKAPMLSYSFTDDPFATNAATNRLMATFVNCNATHTRYSPRELGEKNIGHFAFFSRRFRGSLWPQVLVWLLS